MGTCTAGVSQKNGVTFNISQNIKSIYHDKICKEDGYGMSECTVNNWGGGQFSALLVEVSKWDQPAGCQTWYSDTCNTGVWCLHVVIFVYYFLTRNSSDHFFITRFISTCRICAPFAIYQMGGQLDAQHN